MVSSPEQSVTSPGSAPGSVFAAPAAPDAAPGSAQQRRIQWAPNYSSFIDLNQHPDAIWRDAVEGGGSEGAQGTNAGWYTVNRGGTGSEGYTPDSYNYIGDSAGDNYWALKDAGQWDLSDPNSSTWKYLQAKAGDIGDPMQDINAFYYGLENSGLGQAAWNRNEQGRQQVEDAYREALSQLDPEFVDQFVPLVGQATDNYWTVDKQHENQGVWKDIDDAAVSGRDIIMQTPLGAALAAFTGGLLAPMLGGGAAGAMGAGAITGGAGAALRGGNFGDVLKGAGQGGLSAYGGSEIPGGDAVGGVQVAQVPDEGMLGNAIPAFSTPGSTQFNPEGLPISSTPAMTNFAAGEGMLPVFQAPASTFPLVPTFNDLTDAGLDSMDTQNRDALEAGDMKAPAEATAPSSGIDPRYAKIANTLIGLLGNGDSETGTPEDAPTQQPGQDATSYSQDLAKYLQLDANEMAQLGLQPGSQEYMDYIVQQADAEIARIAGDMDLNAEDLQEQFHTKTDSELLQLQRALYVRGQLDLMMGSGTYTDPFTGIDEEVVAPGDAQFNPSVGAFQRGVARSTDTLAGLSGEEASSFLNDLLGRDTDLFGMNAARASEMERAKLEENDEVRRRRRGMLQY
jgi:hypothetical protein